MIVYWREIIYYTIKKDIEKGYLINKYKKLSKSLNEVFEIARSNGQDGLKMLAMYFCSDELQMSEDEMIDNEDMIKNN